MTRQLTAKEVQSMFDATDRARANEEARAMRIAEVATRSLVGFVSPNALENARATVTNLARGIVSGRPVDKLPGRIWVTVRDWLPVYRRATLSKVTGIPLDTENATHLGPFKNARQALDKVSELFGTTAAENAADEWYK